MNNLNNYDIINIVKDEYQKDVSLLLDKIKLPEISTLSSELLEETGEKFVVEMTKEGIIKNIELQDTFLKSLKENQNLEEFILFQTLRILNPDSMEINSFKKLLKLEPSDLIKELSTIYKDNPQYLSGKDFNNRFYDGMFEEIDIDKFYIQSLKGIKEDTPKFETELFQNFLTTSVDHVLHSLPMNTRRMTKKVDKILNIDGNLKKEFDTVVHIWNEPGEKQITEIDAKKIMNRIFEDFTNNQENKNYIVYETEQLLSELKGIDKVINLDNISSHYEEFIELRNKNNPPINKKNAEVIPFKPKTSEQVAKVIDQFRNDPNSTVVKFKKKKKD